MKVVCTTDSPFLEKFQFLIGAMKAGMVANVCETQGGVSIPYRRNESIWRNCILSPILRWFQFLIGAMKAVFAA